MKIDKFMSSLLIILFITISGSSCEENLYDFDLSTGDNAPVNFTEAPEDMVTKEIENNLCFYCGKPVEYVKDSFLRPLAVVMANSTPTINHSGLQEACLIYEFPFGGETTGLLAFYNHPFTGDIGPVSKGNNFLLRLAEAKGAVLCHHSSSPLIQDVDITELTDFNLASHPEYCRIDTDKKAPYHMYSSIEKLLEGSKDLGLYHSNKLSGLFKFETKNEETEPGVNNNENQPGIIKIEIVYNPDYKVSYLYNKETSRYLRLINDKEHTDANINTAINIDNLIIMHTNITDIEHLDSIKVPIKGAGDGLLVSHGNIYRIRWDRQVDTSTKFYWENGREITLKPGNTWIHITSPQNKIIVY